MILSGIYAADMKPMEGGDLVMVEIKTEAPTEEQAIDQASNQAVQSAVGRVYFSDELIMARTLLEKYIDNYYREFIFSTVVSEKKHFGDRVELTVQVFVNYSKLMQDLREKEFIFKPRVRPYYVVFLNETLNGESADYQHGYDDISDAWTDLTSQRQPDSQITNPPTTVDVTSSELLMDQAIQAAQKSQAEIILTGTSSTVREERQEMYYDTYTFFRTTMNLKLIRVDNGEILKETTVTSLAGSTRQNQAIQISITRAARKAVNDLFQYFRDHWDHMILNEGDFLLMFTGVNDEKLQLIEKRLRSLSDNARVFQKSRYSDVAVLTLLYKGAREKLIESIEESAYPRMHILNQEKNRFEIQIKN